MKTQSRLLLCLFTLAAAASVASAQTRADVEVLNDFNGLSAQASSRVCGIALVDMSIAAQRAHLKKGEDGERIGPAAANFGLAAAVHLHLSMDLSKEEKMRANDLATDISKLEFETHSAILKDCMSQATSEEFQKAIGEEEFVLKLPLVMEQLLKITAN